MEEVIMRKFGDDQSALLDRYERLSVEIQLNQAMLRRSLSEPVYQTRSSQPAVLIARDIQAPLQQPPPLVSKKKGGSGFHKLLRKMIKPIITRMGSVSKKKKAADVELDPRFWKTFSRSFRL